MLLVEEPSVVARIVQAIAGSLQPPVAPGPWSWTHRLELGLRDGTVIDAGLQLDGRGRFALRLPGEEQAREFALPPALRAVVRQVLIEAVDRGELVPNDSLPRVLCPLP